MVKCVRILNIPNAISLLRLVMAFTMLLTRPLGLSFFVLYSLCGISDVVDGLMARRMGITSGLGAKLDSLADLTLFVIVVILISPVIMIEVYQFFWMMIIVLIRGSSFLITVVKFKTPTILHTHMNKATGLMVFFIPFFVGMSIFGYVVAVSLIIATISALEELIIHIFSKELDTNRASLCRYVKAS